MSDLLERFCTLLIENAQQHDIKKLSASHDIKKSINNLKSLKILPPIFNLEHVAAGHKRYYSLKNCPEQPHCFDCLYNDLENKKIECEHSKKLTKYELSHIPYLKSRLAQPEDEGY